MENVFQILDIVYQLYGYWYTANFFIANGKRFPYRLE